jgi:hypothetical protein
MIFIFVLVPCTWTNPKESIMILVSLAVKAGNAVVGTGVPSTVHGVATRRIVSYGATVASVIA